ncbi:MULTISPECIES: ABC transporter permease [unclassified Imperialibacter]|uniref:ABC transporter permease n=1 Tax=unclassified Imperialibacter TaxID=2629706 RepID=UPI001869B242|nr:MULTISPECIES: ABC transporter permease [unclassified Imperialibacter]
MLRNYLKVGFRNILKHKAFSFINVFGLAVAMSVCMLVILMLADQHSYDQFHSKKDRIYRILTDSEKFRQAYATSPYSLADVLRTEYPSVETSTRLMPGVGGDVIYNEKLFEMRGYFAEPAFFEVFDFDLQKGNKVSALSAPNSIVITSELAANLFGKEDPLGKVVSFSDRQLPFPLDHGGGGSAPVEWGTFTVTGVIADEKHKSHIHFDVLMSEATRQRLYVEKKLENLTSNWEHYWQNYTYVVLDASKTEADLQADLQSLGVRKYKDMEDEEKKNIIFKGQRLADIAMGLENNDTNYRLPDFGYYFLGLLSFVVLICACLNYTNLSIARATTRAREIGVRKTNGANRGNLVFQFLTESILTSLLSLGIAWLILVLFLKPAFTNLWLNQHLNFELPTTWSVYLVFFAFALTIGLIAGVYPAFVMASYQPVKVLKSNLAGGKGKMGLRKVLGISQFVVSLLFIVTSILIFRQFKHYLNFEYGFATQNVVNIELQGVDNDIIASELATVPGVTSVSACDIIPAGGINNNFTLRKLGSEDEYTRFGSLHTDEHFIETLEIKLVAGRPLPADRGGLDKYILVNEAAVKAMGFEYPSEIIGQVYETEWGTNALEVVGVVEDFQFKLLLNEDKISPLAMRAGLDHYGFLNVKISSDDLMGTVDKLKAKWEVVDPVHPFKYRFFDEQLAATHQAIFDVVSILGFIAFLSVVIACLGLLGMAAYSAERRTKEVGIRKVMGAPELAIAVLLSKELLWMLTISVGIAAPLSYILNNLWLQYLPNRVEFGFGTVFIGSSLLLLMGLLTIGSQTFRASKRNPVDALRME